MRIRLLWGRIKPILLVGIIIFSLFTVIQPATAAGSTSVSVSPSEESINLSQKTTFDIVVDQASGGVGAHSTRVTLANSEIANITSVQLHGDPGQSSVNYSDDRSSVQIDAALMNTNDTGSVVVASVTVVGVSNGSTPVSLTVDALGDEGGTDYSVTDTGNGTLQVGTVSGPSKTTVRLSPASTTVNVSETVSLDVVVDQVSGGIGAHTTEIALENATLANITDVQLHGNPGLSTINISNDNSTVTIDAALIDTNDTGSVRIASVTVQGLADGTSNISLGVGTRKARTIR